MPVLLKTAMVFTFPGTGPATGGRNAESNRNKARSAPLLVLVHNLAGRGFPRLPPCAAGFTSNAP